MATPKQTQPDLKNPDQAPRLILASEPIQTTTVVTQGVERYLAEDKDGVQIYRYRNVGEQ